MPITVDAPDGSQVEFPDSMQPEEIEGVLSKQFPNKDKERKSLQDEMSKLRFQGFLGEQEQAALGAAENIAKVAAIPATPILKLPRSEGTGVGAGLLNVGAGLAEGLSTPAYWMLPGSKPLQALTAGQIAGNIPQSTVTAIQTLTNPQATTAQKVEASAAPVLEAGTAGLLSGAIRLPGRATESATPEPLPKAPVALNPEETPPVVPQGETPIRLVGEKKTAPWPDALVSKSPTGEGWRLTWFSRFEGKLDPRGHDDFLTREAAVKAAKEMDFEEVPPSGQSGEATPAEAPAVSSAVQEGVTAPPEEPAITETTTEPKVGQVPTVTPPVTEPPTTSVETQLPKEYIGGTIRVTHGGTGELKPGKPAFFSVEPEGAEWYAGERGGETPTLVNADVTINKPARVKDVVDAAKAVRATKKDISKASGYHGENPIDYVYVPKVVSELKRRGFDGVIDFDTLENTDILAAIPFDLSQVKEVSRVLGEKHPTEGVVFPKPQPEPQPVAKAAAEVQSPNLAKIAELKGKLAKEQKALDKNVAKMGSMVPPPIVAEITRKISTRMAKIQDQIDELEKPISEGPGAASPGDVPMGSQLSQLTQTIQKQISPAEPLLDRIKAAVNVADKWAKTKDSATQGIAKARAASQALIHGYLNLPPWRNFEDSVGKWTGADQETALQVRQFQKQIVKAIPSRLRQEAITNWIQADGDEAVLRERAAASKPSVRRGYELALQLNEGEKTLARNVSQYLDARLKEGLANGLLKQGVDNYVTQIWRRPTSATQKLWADLFGTGALNPNFKYARRRIFDSYFEGEQAGYIPKNKTIGNLISQYDLAFNRALSARALIKQLQTGKAGDGMPITMTSGKTTPVGNAEEIPEAYLIKPNQPPTGAVSGDGRPYRPIDHWALRDWKWATKGPQGQNVFVQGDMLVHPDYYTRLNNALKTSRLRQPEGIGLVTGPLLKGAAVLKQTKLSLSPFHTVQEGVHAMAHRVNPFAPGEIDLSDPIQKGLVDHGLMVQDPRAHELFAEGSSGGGLIGKIPGLGRLQQAYTDLTFRDYIPKLKMEMAKDAFDRNMKAYSKQLASGKVTPDQIMALTARESNAAFGEQNYKMMGRSPNVQDVLRLSLLAPDFLESRFRFVAQALKPYGREQRIALGLMFGTLYTASRMINKATDDNYHWFDHPFSVFINGREYRLRTVLGDVQHLITDPRSFWYNRLSPVSRTISEYITGRDDRGIKRSSAEQFVDFLSWFKPIPTQIRSDQTLGQAALAATGIPSKSYTKSQQVYELVDNWMKNSKDPRVQERYQRLRQETLPDSPYRPLRDALKRDDLKAAKAEYLKLRQSRNDSVISEAMRQNRTFTGSLQSENKFKASLTEEQKRLYEQAIQERKDTYQKFLKAKGLK